MPQNPDDPGLIVRAQAVHAMGKASVKLVGIANEGIAGQWIGPAPPILQGLWKVPVVECDVGLDASACKALKKAGVKREACFVPGAAPIGLNPGPADREAVGIDPQAGDQVEVFFKPVVVVTGQVAVAAVGNGSRLAAKGIPDRRCTAVLIMGPFDLIRRGRYTPQESSWKLCPGQGIGWGGLHEHGISLVRVSLAARQR